jgi:membrane fusion protein, multidrug efflux system
VDKDNKVASREVVTDRVIGNKWLIDSGLQSGDKLIVEGTGKVQPGQTVKAVETGTTTTDTSANTAGGN